MRRKRNGRVLIVYRWPDPAALLAEWRRRRTQCAADLRAAKAAGDLVRYRVLRARWERFYARDPALSQR